MQVFLAAVLVAATITSVPPPPPATTPTRFLGEVVTTSGLPLEDATVSMGENTTVTGADGRFVLEAVTPGEFTVTRPAYAPRTLTWDGDYVRVPMAKRIVRGLHVSGPAAASNTHWAEILDIADDTAVNAVVIDIKSESGRVFHQTEVQAAIDIGASDPRFDLRQRVQEAHDHGLYVLVRIVSFEDPIAAANRPAWAAYDTTTGKAAVRDGLKWLDPSDVEVQQYVLDLAVEACDQGVDEVQFDYVRFPSGDKGHIRFDGGSGASASFRQATITEFAARGHDVLTPMGCASSADIFGFITNKPHEGNIGQHLESLAGELDALSPMIYPSHYSTGWYGFSVPNNHPGPVVWNASNDALVRLPDYPTVLRPWLQDFWYTAAQVREQIVTVDGLGIGWLLWNAHSDFTVSGIPTDSQLTASDDAGPPTVIDLPDSGFFDVPDHSLFSAEVAWIAGQGITEGCNPPWGDNFCPDEWVKRGQMAAFLARALDLPIPTRRDTFSDDDGHAFEGEIEALVEAGITVGCDVDAFCPEERVGRGQMATFLQRALALPIPSSDTFTDDDISVHEPAIEALVASSITLGCGTGRFCPFDGVERQHMAAFLFRALSGLG